MKLYKYIISKHEDNHCISIISHELNHKHIFSLFKKQGEEAISAGFFLATDQAKINQVYGNFITFEESISLNLKSNPIGDSELFNLINLSIHGETKLPNSNEFITINITL